MNYPRNAWYVAAMHEEIKPGALLARTFLDEPIVMFRDPDGLPQALADRCPHRFAPLSAGTLCENGRMLRCGYHGLAFDGSGACVHSPHGAVPSAARVRPFPLAERDGIVWIWLGAADLADPAQIPDYAFVTQAPPDATIRGYMPTACDAMLLVDNILDLSHADFLHSTSLGSGAISRVKPTVTEPDPRSVRITWLSSGDFAPPGFDRSLREQGQPTDQWTEVTWTAPTNMLLDVGATLVGEPRSQGCEALALHLATPETEGRTHYWYWTSRKFDISPESNAIVASIIENAFRNEDKPMLEAQQRRMGGADFWSLKPVLLPSDAGAVRVRRRMQALLQAEAEARAA